MSDSVVFVGANLGFAPGWDAMEISIFSRRHAEVYDPGRDPPGR